MCIVYFFIGCLDRDVRLRSDVMHWDVFFLMRLI